MASAELFPLTVEIRFFSNSSWFLGLFSHRRCSLLALVSADKKVFNTFQIIPSCYKRKKSEIRLVFVYFNVNF